MTQWTNGFNTFETEEEAREDAYEEITWDDIENYFEENISFHDFFTRVRESMPDFFDKFEDDILNAEDEYFSRNYYEEETDEDE